VVLRDLFASIIENVEKVIVGKTDVVHRILVALVAGGHVLIEDAPGVGKTTLARAIARSVGMSFSRIQFTPDLMPSDVTGTSVLDRRTGEFAFRPGPVMNQMVLADEINRTSPKTQSSLLECMQERQVTVDGVTYPLPEPFLVIATQNPIEYEGTFPLPEAQLDRFLVRVRVGYPLAGEEAEMLARHGTEGLCERLDPVCSAGDVARAQREAEGLHVDEAIRSYVVAIANATRRSPDVRLGASPRASLALYRSARARAYLQGRDYVSPEDVKTLAPYVLCHRLVLAPESEVQGVTSTKVVEEVLARVPVPAGVPDDSR